MLLEGLKQLFHQAGGVPTHLRIDNLSAAVITIGKVKIVFIQKRFTISNAL